MRLATVLLVAASGLLAAYFVLDGLRRSSSDQAGGHYSPPGGYVPAGAKIASPASSKFGGAWTYSDSPALARRAEAVHLFLKDGYTRASCSGPVRQDLESLLEDSSSMPALWTWAFDSAIQCSHALEDLAWRQSLFMEALLLHDGNPRVLELAGQHNLEVGSPVQAIDFLKRALAIQESFSARDLLGEAYAMAARKPTEGQDQPEPEEQWRLAAENSIKALEQAPQSLRPMIMLKVARALTSAGAETESMDWARRAESEIGLLEPGHQARLLPDFSLQLGEVYVRNGQYELGKSYMNQAVTMATTEADRKQFTSIRDAVLGAARPVPG